jgi:hypothetical protein
MLELQATNGVKHSLALLTEIAERAADKDCERLRHVTILVAYCAFGTIKWTFPKADFGKTAIKMRVKTSPLLEIARVLVRLDHVASGIVKRESYRTKVQ